MDAPQGTILRPLLLNSYEYEYTWADRKTEIEIFSCAKLISIEVSFILKSPTYPKRLEIFAG